MHKVHLLAWQALPATDFAMTHCTQCAAGCFLDRGPVFPNMISCNRFEPKEELETKHATKQ